VTAQGERWMQPVLWAAALYNLLFGVIVVIFPALPFRWAGLPLPNYPEIWQCLGMVIGVYGIGYAIAATNPRRHWPIVLECVYQAIKWTISEYAVI
jgi:small multidrug resistance pump